MHKTSKLRDFLIAVRLARAVQRHGRKLVTSPLLYSLVASSAGCVVPTELERETPAPNQQPSLVTALVSPPLGQIVLSKSQPLEIKIVATDPNPDDTLVARTFIQMGNTLIGYNTQVALMKEPTVDPEHALYQYGTFDDYQYCAAVVNSGTYLLFVYVSDRPFDGNSYTSTTGLTDSNHWELQCM